MRKKTLTELSIIAGTTIVAYINETQIVPKLLEDSPQLLNSSRNLDHLLAGIGVPYIYGLTYKIVDKYIKSTDTTNYPNKFFAYVAVAAYWETTQAINRGNFQIDQFTCDMIGAGIAYTIDKIFLKDKFAIKNKARL
jgi:hypothetical protein